MAKLPIDLSGREVRAALERAGFVFRRQSGSHMILRRDEPHARVVVPRRTPSKQKFVGERRRSQLAKLDGAVAARMAILLFIWGNFALDTIIYVFYIFSVEWRLT